MARSPLRPLTDQDVKSLAPQSTPIDLRDGGQRGLIVTILPSGRKQFSIRYRFAGKQKRLPLGEYPTVTLAKARKLARHEQTAVDAGHDPAGTRQMAKRAPTDTVAALAADYLKRHALKKKKSGAEDQRVLTVDVLPKWGKRSVREITRRDVRDLIDGIADRGAPIMANRTLEIIRKMLNYGVQNDWLDANPAARLAKPGVEHSRERVLTDDEIRRLWRVLSREQATEDRPAPGRRAAKRPDDPFCPISPALAAVQKLRLVTGQRGGECVRMRWADVNLDSGWWVIPGADAKNGQPHRVPLVERAVEIISAQEPDEAKRGEFVFTGRGNVLPLDRLKKASSAIAKALDVDFHSHDLRRTAATRMAEAGIPSAHISKVLNHIEGGPKATKTYVRFDYDAEKRMALETWDRALTAILTAKPKTGADVVSIRRTR